MSLSLIPDSAPFNVEQRAWLNGFLAGWLGLPGSEAPPTMPVAAVPAEEFPWHDAALALDERLALAEDRPTERKLMAAMAQLDCGACGYVCQTYAEAIAKGEEKRLTLCSPGGSDTTRAIKRLLKDAPAVTAAPAPQVESAGWSRFNPYPARLIDSRNLNGDGSAKRTHHVEIDLSEGGLTYEAGDALGVYPVNCGGLVESVMETIGAPAETTVWTGTGETSFREALLRDCCLTRPGEDLIALLAESTRDGGDAKALRALLEDDGPIKGWDVLDLLHHFASARPSASAFVAALPELSPRLYSISSSPNRHAGQVHLTVGRVAYERNSRVRKGVASTMLADRLAPGDRLRVFVHKSPKFRLPADPAAPVIMVGPGTGVAPVPCLPARPRRLGVDRQELALLRRPVPRDRLPLRGGVPRPGRARAAHPARHRLQPRRRPQGLRPEPDGRVGEGTLRLD